ncbi:hypothetical protein [Comamonas jiangduensis]|uniref:hypothetical protein n=1 Tax=Comamonas jiangduensis TaxID=1194168 RepID=UPI003BF7A86A
MHVTNSHTADVRRKPAGEPPFFELGRVVATRAVHELIVEGRLNPVEFLTRHINADWGEVPEEDWTANNRSVGSGRILSAYDTACGVRFWIITEWDRSVTTLLLPEDY